MVALFGPLRIEAALLRFGPIEGHSVVGAASAAALTNFSAIGVGYVFHLPLSADARGDFT